MKYLKPGDIVGKNVFNSTGCVWGCFKRQQKYDKTTELIIIEAVEQYLF